ncbi:hypothetical protein BD626DRAFT_486526, partial [Schizophyllum amplum]
VGNNGDNGLLSTSVRGDSRSVWGELKCCNEAVCQHLLVAELRSYDILVPPGKCACQRRCYCSPECQKRNWDYHNAHQCHALNPSGLSLGSYKHAIIMARTHVNRARSGLLQNIRACQQTSARRSESEQLVVFVDYAEYNSALLGDDMLKVISECLPWVHLSTWPARREDDFKMVAVRAKLPRGGRGSTGNIDCGYFDIRGSEGTEIYRVYHTAPYVRTYPGPPGKWQ